MKAVLDLTSKRLLLGLLTMFLVTVVIFMAVELRPGDFADMARSRTVAVDAVDHHRDMLALDKPAYHRYIAWLGKVLTGDLGYSYSGDRSVADLIGYRFYNTAFLAIYAALLAFPLSLLLGFLTTLFRNGLFDRFTNLIALVAVSLPEFFLAYMLIAFFAVGFWNGEEMIFGGWFPAISILGPEHGFWEKVQRTTLPAVTLTFVILAHTMRMTKASIMAILSSPYIEMAHLKGLTKSRILWKHAVPNALAPIFNVIAVNLAFLLVGVFIIEVVFAFPGLGSLLIDSVGKRNIPVVQGAALIFAVVYIGLNFLADLMSTLTNPRLLHPK